MKKRHRIAAGFTGPSGSGKTTLILKLCGRLISEGSRVVTVKTNSNEKADFFPEEKDSTRYFNIGADVILAAPANSLMFSHGGAALDELAKMAGDFDFLLIEGLRRISLPRICMFRDRFEPEYLQYAQAICAGPDIDKKLLVDNAEYLDPDDVDSIIEWIYKNGIRCP